MSEKKAPLYQGTPKLCNNGSICLRSSLLLCWGLASSPWWHAFVCFRGDKSPVWLLWMCFRSSDICDFHWQLQWWKHFNKTTHPELAMQLTNLSSRKLFFIPLLWSITGYLGLPKMLDVDWKMVQVCSSCMQQDSCKTFIFATFCPECWTILAFGVAKMPKMSKLLPGPEWSWSCYTSEAISISITFSLDRSLCEKVSGSLIIYYIIGNLLFQCCVATFLGQKFENPKLHENYVRSKCLSAHLLQPCLWENTCRILDRHIASMNHLPTFSNTVQTRPKIGE